jgi:arylsulfatase
VLTAGAALYGVTATVHAADKKHETVDHSMWASERMFMLATAAAYVGQWLQSFRDFPPRMKPGSFSLERVMEAATAAGKARN